MFLIIQYLYIDKKWFVKHYGAFKKGKTFVYAVYGYPKSFPIKYPAKWRIVDYDLLKPEATLEVELVTNVEYDKEGIKKPSK